MFTGAGAKIAARPGFVAERMARYRKRPADLLQFVRLKTLATIARRDPGRRGLGSPPKANQIIATSRDSPRDLANQEGRLQAILC
ncbi:MAG: hypothetical protein E5Y00_12160 [Mesorhizobium sp.]|nr:MAG: hypothetical protein E5Y00_12160 [Mesorhizobium sp.]TIR45807.1 MAG: hypothetical protein E5X28_14175 [Mesorhizobium sp.]TIS00663.1 MAG: hypothetical protein E5X14_27230 [Mesorhizobium sp.]